MGKKGLFFLFFILQRIPFNKGIKNEGNRKAPSGNSMVIIDADHF